MCCIDNISIYVYIGPQDINFAKPDFHEYYDLDLDPWEMNNKYVWLLPVTSRPILGRV